MNFNDYSFYLIPVINTSGSKLVLYDEKGNILAESLPIGKGFRWRHALTIAPFGEGGQRLLVEVQTPHIGSRAMEMYGLIIDEENEQVLLILPSQSKTELAALRLVSGEIHEEWRIALGGKLSGNLELINEKGVPSIGAIVDNNKQVLLNIPE